MYDSCKIKVSYCYSVSVCIEVDGKLCFIMDIYYGVIIDFEVIKYVFMMLIGVYGE